VSIAALRALLAETGLQPACAAGHSLGEYSALVCAGALSFADAVRTVRQRGTFMQEAVPVGTGSMAAMLGIERPELEAICAEAAQGEVVAPANFNSPGQIVIAGHATAVSRAIEIAKARGFRKAMPLPVSAPFHCALMQPAAERLQAVLDEIAVADPQLPVISNVDAQPNRDGQRVKALLVAQVCAPVRWEESVVAMAGLGVTRFIEIGPGKVLSGLAKRIVKETEVGNCENLASLDALR
jgi:[acyl-carrier-protein] S-malonyltransferase